MGFATGALTGALAGGIAALAFAWTAYPSAVTGLPALRGEIPAPPVLFPLVGMFQGADHEPDAALQLFSQDVGEMFLRLVREAHGEAYAVRAYRRPGGALTRQDARSSDPSPLLDALDAAAIEKGWTPVPAYALDRTLYGTRGYRKDGYVFAVAMLSDAVAVGEATGASGTAVLVDNSRLGRRQFDAAHVGDVVPLAIVTDLPSDMLFEAPWLDEASWVVRRDGTTIERATFLKDRGG